MNLQALVEHVGEEQFEEACHWAWRTAAGTGTSRGGGDDWPGNLKYVPHELEDLVWCEGDAAWTERVALAFELYGKMPCYGNLMYAAHYFSQWDGGAREHFWRELRLLISDEDDRLADPVAYSLWCDYFEDVATVDGAWREIAQREGLTEKGLERVLDVSGPVPFRLKAPLYEQLVADGRWHEPIFRSLLHSAFDVYGDLDEEAARRLLARLELPDTTAGLSALKERLSSESAGQQQV